MSKPFWSAGLVVAAIAAAAAGYLFGREAKSPTPPPPPVAETQAIPELRPIFSLEDTSGTPTSITKWDGKPLMINFWATWCAPCRREIPLLNTLRAEYAGKGFEVVGVAVDFRDDVLRYMETTPIDYPVLIGEQAGLDVVKAFGLAQTGFPVTVFTDRGGRIVTVHVGELHREEADVILGAVEDLEAGRTDLDSARTAIRAGLAATKPG